MLVDTSQLLNEARRGGYSAGAFNVYNMEQVRAVVDLAESLAYLSQAAEPELVELMHALVDGVKVPVQSKMALFGSVGKAKQ